MKVLVTGVKGRFQSEKIYTRKIYLEVMRIVAIFLVIFNHLPGYTLYMYSTGIKQVIYMILTMITRINVPLFFMISGALLLNKNNNFCDVRKRLLRFLCVLFVFSFILALLRFEDFHNIKMLFISFLYDFISGNIESSYWFLYAYLSLIMVLPFMQRIAGKMTKSDFYLILLIHFIFSSLIPIINCLLTLNKINPISISGDLSLPLFNIKCFFYPLIGYGLEKFVNVDDINKKKIVYYSLLCSLGILLSCVCTFIEGINTGNYTQNYVQLFDYVTAIYFYIVIKKIFSNYNNKTNDFIIKMGSLTFGIYLLDPFLKMFLYGFIYNFFENTLPTIIASFIWCLISMVLGGLIAIILKKIPLFKKIL